jgi:short-subunit dehydrogenase
MHVVITGASSGIGAALAREFHAAGAAVTLVARGAERLAALASELGAGCRTVTQDVTAPGDWLRQTHAWAPIDVFINNAGIQNAGPFATSRLEEGVRVVGVDLLAPLSLTREVLPQMLRRGTGTLVNVSSVAALAPPPGMAWYAAAKAGLAAFSEALSAELADSGVHVLTVYPGPIDNGTAQLAYALYGEDSVATRLPVGQPAALAREIRRAVTRRRPRLIYPRFYALAWWFAAAARWLVARGAPRLRATEARAA